MGGGAFKRPPAGGGKSRGPAGRGSKNSRRNPLIFLSWGGVTMGPLKVVSQAKSWVRP